MTRGESDALERRVAEWLLVADNYDETVASHFDLDDSLVKPEKWQSRLRPPGGYENKRGRMQQRQAVFGETKITYWQTELYAPEFDLWFDLHDVPYDSLLSSLLFSAAPATTDDDLETPLDDYTERMPPELSKKVKDQGYVTVEVKSCLHAHHDPERATYTTYPAEFLNSEARASGFTLTESDLWVAPMRNFCMTPECGYTMCSENRARAKAERADDPRRGFAYYVLPTTVMGELLVRALMNPKRRMLSSESNGDISVCVELKRLRQETLLREATAKRFARLLPPRKPPGKNALNRSCSFYSPGEWEH